MSSNRNGCVKDPKESQAFGLDDILLKIGKFGKFQLGFFGLIFLLVVFHTVIKDGFVFTASAVSYRCQIPECDGSEKYYDKPWTKFSIPKTSSGQLEKCQRYQTFSSTSSPNVCSAESFNQEFKINCGHDFIFRTEEVTISNDFDIFCADEWKLAMVGTINSFGQVVGMPLGGYLSDRYGRSRIIAVVCISCAIIGIIRSFSLNYNMFVFCGFLDNAFGSTIFGTAFVLALEILAPSVRVHACTMLPMFGGIGRFLLAVGAQYFQNWRLLELFVYVPALGFLALPWILPESFRWLLSQGEEEKAIKILKKSARLNKRKLSDVSIEMLLQANRQNVSGSKNKIKKLPIGDAFKLFPWRIINCSLCWFTNSFVFLGLSLNSTLFGENKFTSFMYVSLIEIPGTLLPSLTINRFGRKLSLLGHLFFTGFCITAMIFLKSDSGYLQLMFNLLGKMSITASFQILYIFTSEIFPTNARNTMLSFCSMIGRMGSMAAPQGPLLAKYYASGPSILFASSAFLSGSLTLLLPETKDTGLPTTLQDAGKIGQKETKIETETEEVAI